LPQASPAAMGTRDARCLNHRAGNQSRSDVFSSGWVDYELLGEHPGEITILSKTLHCLTAICGGYWQ
jgi:hypothetical protein